MTNAGERTDFLDNVKRALGRTSAPAPSPVSATRLSSTRQELEARVREIERRREEKGDELVGKLEGAALNARWNVARAYSLDEACLYLKGLAQDKAARTVVHSAHTVLRRMSIEECLSSVVPTVRSFTLGDGLSASQREAMRASLRRDAISAEIGVTGADYAIAETGTCVLISRRGTARQVSLMPPVHVAVVERRGIVETIDDVLTLLRWEFFEKGAFESYVNLISGPSRTADIEQTLTVGVHGPKEAHMVILDVPAGPTSSPGPAAQPPSQI